MSKIKMNGKLYIAGEYQVLKKGGNALILAVNKHLELSIVESLDFYYETRGKKYFYSLNDEKVEFRDNHENKIVKHALETVFCYLKNKKIEISSFGINIKSELENNDGKKYGFGSSAAVISGIIKVILKHFHCEFSQELLFKLAVLTQIASEELTSGGDLASVIYGGIIYYERYDLEWVKKHFSNPKVLTIKWPHLKIVSIESNLLFGAVWSKQSHKTGQLTKELTKKALKTARNIVNRLYVSLVNNRYLETKVNLIDYQRWLNEILHDEKLITAELKLALEIAEKHGLAAKISGAGGGDSIIFTYPKGYDFTNLKKELIKNDLELFIF